MIIGLGVDIVSIDRIRGILNKYGAHFESRFFSVAEIGGSRSDRAGYYAKRFAAKEAFLKAVGTGLAGGFVWQEIEVLNNDLGAPYIKLCGGSNKLLHRMYGEDVSILLSLSDEKHYAVGCVIIAR